MKLRHFKKIAFANTLIQPLTPDELQISINKSAEHLRVLWISYSLFAVYLIITSLSVTHRHLFLELPLRLPALNIDLGLQDFFVAAPILFIGMHLYLVFHVNLLRQQIVKYQDIIRTEVAMQEKKSYLFDPFVFLQSWVGHAKGWRSQLGFSIITHGSLKVFPICVLLLIMLSALPYHDEKLTHYHRFMVILDFMVIAVFAVNWKKKLQHLICRILITSMAFIGLFISLYGILIFQGEDLYKLREEGFYTQEQPFKEQEFPFLNRFIPVLKIASPFLEFITPFLKSRTKSLLEGEPNYVTGKPESLFANRLVLVNEDFVDNKILADIYEKEDTKEKDISSDSLESLFSKTIYDTNYDYKMLLRKRGRHFENAVFDYSNLPRTDFTGAYISGASFSGSNLEKSNFSCDKLPDDKKKNSSKKKCRSIQNKNVDFSSTKLKNVNFNSFILKNTNFTFANLQNAKLSAANLQNTYLDSAQLQNATLGSANLQNAYLYKANLQNAKLHSAKLQNANLHSAQLQNADLSLAQLQNADFHKTALQGADLSSANLQNADFDKTELQGADLSSANLQNAYFYQTELQGANLSSARLQNAYFYQTNLQGVDLSFAKLQGARFDLVQLQSANFYCTNLEYARLKYINIWNNYFYCDKNNYRNFDDLFYDNSVFDNNTIFLENIVFEDDAQTSQDWRKKMFTIKEYQLQKCSHDKNKKTCTNNIEKWFQQITHPTEAQIQERQKMWQNAQDSSYYKNKTKHEFMQNFWQYQAEKLVCDRKVAIDSIIKKLDPDDELVIVESFIEEYKKIFAQTLFKQIDARKCYVYPALTEEQRTTLEGWFKASD